ncbi:hypothetical protein QBC46DRAFT_282877 [Diplogelasinospora grovesii]|uniref:Midasin n=1 Tax=Diplogelasinospora grovesii TaxID=303347 RepID=A0AAN6NDH9_9PEZI|nr:hypothetical protein QBC46DRAFT_282877 [Diplogelasinospora grovesii]
MAVIDVNRQRTSLLCDETTLGLLPQELVLIIKDQQSIRFLDAIAEAALVAPEKIFAHFESVFADICARWLISSPKLNVRVLTAFARILPFSQSLSVFLTGHLIQQQNDPDSGALKYLNLESFRDEKELLLVLLALWRLNNFDKRTYAALSKPSHVQGLFAHRNLAVRYLAIRIFCQLHNASDLKLESMLKKHIQKDGSLIADLDGRHADYTFLTLYEESRGEEVRALRRRILEVQAGLEAKPTESLQSQISMQSLTPLVVHYGKTVLPRPLGPVNTPSTLALTPTTTDNLESLCTLLQKPGPILLHGLSGSGKTSLVHEVARELGKQQGLVTLHLNEQTDAKMLLGLYTTDSKPGSFQWRAGVLTTAVKEGRWVLIEDLDRAPTEVMSTLLPLIERGELLIPGRGEKIQASDGFRIFATVRTSMGMNDKENLPALIGLRLWQLLHVKPLPRDDLSEVINSRFPLLHKYIPGILAVFDRLLATTSGSNRTALGRSMIERPIGTRDLLKWCGRLDHVLRAAGCSTGEEPITDTTRDRMFLEAVDCFVGSVKENSARAVLVAAIAKEMHLSAERVQHYLTSYVPELEDNEAKLTAGRVSFAKRRRQNQLQRSKRPFASTTHAKRLLEQIAVAVRHREPTLLVGETGIGKTTVVQQLAESLGHKLIAVNLSQQSEAGDLLGGFKPVSSQSLAMPLKEEFEDLFAKTGVSAEKNKEYLDRINKKFAKGRWREVSKEWRKSPKMFEAIISKLETSENNRAVANIDGGADGQPAKRRKTESSKLVRLRELRTRWDAFSQSLDQFDRQVSSGSGNFAFAFVEGKIVKALRNGDWVLLDEINLASPDTLESIADLLQPSPSLLLSETGDIERIQAHAEFRVFGAMNPATDVGKRDLPLGLRSRFTEIYVGSPDRDKKDLLTIIKTYLKGNNSIIDRLADSIADLYLEIKRRAEAKTLVDQANEVPHFSLRTLTRVLTYANDVSPFYGIERALYEGFCMGFTTLLSEESEKTVMPLIQQHLLKRPQILSQPPKRPTDGRDYVNFRNTNKDHQYWLLQGRETPMERSDYIITPYVERNLLNLVRATSTRRYPILIQGPTSSGKTSMIEYLANYTGNKFVRINNHEHTDLQEYLGTYVSDSDGKLRFQEGLLVQAMREGSWIVLDELNLAPTDVLEALNRLLDDNRELLIPETQEVVRPAENFCLFATQNPPGLYGGRKVLSRAFRNRFLELHFDDIPENELETILQKRSRNTAPSDCRRIVAVYKQLTRLRQESRVFEQKNSFATLRDLFRWALRESETRQDLAENGFMLLAERVRKQEERDEVRHVIEEVFKVTINPNKLFDWDAAAELQPLHAKNKNSQGVIWTRAMRLRNRGAILESLLRDLEEAAVHLANTSAYRSLEELQAWYQALSPSDIAKLPHSLKERIRSSSSRCKALFEWCDGSLVHAMKEASYFLLDEISLADDSVLERLNSVLEPHRSLLLAEKGVSDSFVVAADGFQFFATMNPGGDFGKKELSPALRNRFTEIWVPSLSEADDVHDIVISKLDRGLKLGDKSKKISRIIVEFSSWFGKTFRPSSATAFSVRDILAWVQFMNTLHPAHSAEFALLHGAAMVFIDTIGANPSALSAVDPRTMGQQRQLCLEQLSMLAGCDLVTLYHQEPQINMTNERLSIGDFGVERSPAKASDDPGAEIGVPTTKMNAMRVVRALQGTKPILLEGNPGVGKTTLITALARACGKPLTRINLSDQTDLMDLFGTDVPVEGAEAGNFAWKNAPFLEAMQNGSWVLLDEMNLASQTVLEGLNACLDHRGEVYISELDQVFKRHPDFKLFAAQNPHQQGGGRKGLPSSFVNRFVVVYSDVFTKQDLLYITAKKFAKIGSETQHQLIEFMSRLDDAVVTARSFGAQGSPWEFNLRDTLRWGDLLTSHHPLIASGKPDDFLDVIIRQRFRTERDRREVDKLFTEIFQRAPSNHNLYHDINPRYAQVGLAMLQRDPLSQQTPFPCIDTVPRLREIESIMIAIEQDLPCILVGPSGSGKSALLNHVAALAGKALVTFSLNADVDTMDLIGGFEQADPHRELQACLSRLRQALQEQILRVLPEPVSNTIVDLMAILNSPATEERQHYETILSMIEMLQGEASADKDLAAVLLEASSLLRKPLTLENPRFEWLDGVIVRAVETGAWLVLDNANLCSASVLDRLNSLLERPHGYLSINEHSGPGGEPRIIDPHPDFRIFLTVDPRYGELSRAMRNRSIEIYLDVATLPETTDTLRVAPIEGSLQRYHTAARILNSSTEQDTTDVVSLAFDALSLGDTMMLSAFLNAMSEGLLSYSALMQSPTTGQWLSQLVSYTQSEDASFLRQSVSNLYSSSPDRMLMPLHPLQNTPMIPLLQGASGEGMACWLANCYEFYFAIQTAQKTMETQFSKVNLSKPSSMNRLQRSCISDKVASVSKDSTSHAARFLMSVLQAFRQYTQEQLGNSGSWRERTSALRRLMHFWKRTFASLTMTNFEEARFQAHLTQGSKLMQHFRSTLPEGHQALVSMILQYLERDFVVGFKLSTGLSMEDLWQRLRPEPIQDLQRLGQIIEMERLADRFDTLRWKAEATIPNLRTIQDSMAMAYTVIRHGKGDVDAAGLLKDLQSEISSLESRIGQHAETNQPFFAAGFEALRGSTVLHQVSQDAPIPLNSSDVIALSNMPTVGLMRLRSAKATDTLHLVDYMLAQDSEARPWAGTLSKSLLLKCDSATRATMQELQSIEVEIPILGRAVAGASEALATDPLQKTGHLLLKLIEEVVCAHDESCKGQILHLYRNFLRRTDFMSVDIIAEGASNTWFELMDNTSNWPQHLIVIFNEHISKAVMALAAAEKGIQPRATYASIAWVQFALACIKLFVPDKIFDPYHRAQVELEEYQEMYNSLQRQIAALEAFERAFTGQQTNLRAKLLKEEVECLGEPPSEVQSIYRPETGAELRGLQGEFNNVLNALVQSDVSSSHRRLVAAASPDAVEELALVEQNLARLITRFTGSGRFDAYQDLTMPLVSFLRCLQMGLSLGKLSLPGESEAVSLTAITPFINGTIWKAEKTSDIPVRSLEFLSFVGAVTAVEGVHNLPEFLRHALYESLAAFHTEWSKKLEADRKIEEARTATFRFKGSLEDEEQFDQEEFDQLFPDYAVDEEGEPKLSKVDRRNRVRDLSVMLAEAHERIFLSPQDPQESLRGLVKQVARKIARGDRQNITTGEPELDRLLLPATILVFEEQAKAFNSSTLASAGYNFYTDPNLAEVRKVLAIVGAIKTRFQDLQMVDEIGHHQTLADVIAACDKVLALNIDEPLAKVIIAIEHLHAFVYEWHEGGWASRTQKATTLYEKLRDTICDWRRLELTSWSQLLDGEAKRCHDDAKSWWFIAYGAVLLEPCQRLQNGEDVQKYAVAVLEILQGYFGSASLGQFVARLNLLRQLKNHLDLLTQDAPGLAIVRDAVQNFIVYYSRYERKVTEAITAGRAPLDRSMKDVLLLSKWRDKNIDALRESAKKSHQKLFRLVRKFRAVLEQPVRGITDQGLPDEGHSTAALERSFFLITHKADYDAITACKQLIPGIASHPQWERMSSSPGNIVSAILKHGRLPSTAVNASDTLDSYISDLASSISALRKETPGMLTDENKEAVKHLKVRKTKLYNETLKTLREMGFSRNLGTKILETQSSTRVVLVGSGLVPNVDMGGAEYFYHKTLDLAPKVRHSALGHNDDLSRDAVHRSIGYLEGVLHVMFRQRKSLSKTAQAAASLEKAIKYVEAVSTTKEVQTQKRVTNHAQLLRWVIQILKFGVNLVDVHGKLGDITNDSVRNALNGWIETFNKLEKAQKTLPQLPEGFSSAAHDEFQFDMDMQLKALGEGLRELEQNRPDLAFVLQQIQLWTEVQATDIISEGQEIEMESLGGAILTLSSKVLVAIQNFRAATQDIPSSIEDAGWLVKYSDTLEKCLDSFRMDKIGQEIQQLLRQLKTAPNMAILLRVILPILQQFTSVAQANLLTFAELHRTTCQLGYHLSASFVQIAGSGFCTPPEKSDDKSGENGQLESGTGLGEGEGAEDISKDIQPDEDLSELAQDPQNNQKKEDGEMEDEKDAVDMGNEDMEGDLGSVAGDDEEDDKDKSGDEEEENDMDEEAGDVDDLDPTAVDEKMWDGEDEEEAEKDQQGDKDAGKENKHDQSAATEDKGKQKKQEEGGGEQQEGKQEEGEEEEAAGEEQEEGNPEQQRQDEMINQDQHVEEKDALDLPDDMNIDIDDEGEDTEDDNLDDLDEANKDAQPEEMQDEMKDDVASEDEIEQGDAKPDEMEEDNIEEESKEEEGDKEKVAGEEEDVDMEQGEDAQAEEQDKPDPLQNPDQQDDKTADQAAPSDVQTGSGQDQDNMAENQADQTQNDSAAQREQGQVNENTQPDQTAAAGQKGAISRSNQAQEQNGQLEEQGDDGEKQQPFKKLGDALERWYNSQKDIHKPSQEKQEQPTQGESADMAKMEFQHLQDENAEVDTQAMGAAADDEVRPIDESMAVDTEDQTGNPMLDEDEQMEEDIPMDDAPETQAQPPADSDKTDRDEVEGAGVSTRRGAYDVEDDNQLPGDQQKDAAEGSDDEIQEKLEVTHIAEARELRGFDESLQMWTDLQTKTQALSLSLTSQLRLILTPSQSTKLSGSFRTGKRLNIKKIIPYIASSYKRDKIWMRRAIPTKRAYQILLCVDDSSSMSPDNGGVGAAAGMALESLVMVTRALTMLEVGQIGVLGFGSDVFVAHDLTDPPLSSYEAGARIMQNFKFKQEGTDMVRLVRTTIDRFRDARLMQAGSSGSEDLWQLALILSDGLVQSRDHARLRPLLREALEQRVMVVFIIMDEPNRNPGAPGRGTGGSGSVLELKEARFGPDGIPVIHRYLDSFPFPYYLIVHHLEDLPGALAGLLRTWFAEVNS